MPARKHRSKSPRAICPKCFRNVAANWNADMTLLRSSSTYLLVPHNVAPGERCRGWIVGKEAMVDG